MSITFKPKFVPSDVVARWPLMALALWKRSFKHQIGILLSAALLMKFLPAWSALIGFLLAPSLFVIAFCSVEIVDEHRTFTFGALIEKALSGALRLAYISLQFAVGFAVVMAVLFSLSMSLVNSKAEHGAAMMEGDGRVQSILAGPVFEPPQSVVTEFVHFCATWAEGVMAMMFLGLFIIAIYQGIFGAILHAQEGMGTRLSRTYGWQAWQINTGSIEDAIKNAPPKFYMYLGIALFGLICGFQNVYFSPVGLVLATYMPCLAYVAYRSIFHGKHDNVAEANRISVTSSFMLVPAPARSKRRW